MKNVLCLVAARSGSKRLPRKNLINLCGKPLVAHTIEHAKLAGLTDIAISSDCDEIISAATQAGAGIAIKRPAELATDQASSFAVISHALEFLDKEYDAVLFIQVTSPLRLPSDIIKALEIFYQRPAGSLVSVVKAKCIDVELEGGKVKLAEGFGKDRYRINGSIYIWDVKRFKEEPKHIHDDSRLLVMPDLRSIDIDYQSDFDIAETIMQKGDYTKGESFAAD